MYQDTHFSQVEDFSDVPQLPFPEPAQPGVLETDTLKHPLPTQTQPNTTLSSPQQQPFPMHTPTNPATLSSPPQQSFPAPTSSIVLSTPLQQPSPISTNAATFASPLQSSATQLMTGHDYTKTTSPRQLPSTETIDTSQIPPLRPLPPNAMVEETTQPLVAQQKPPMGATAQPAQPFPPQANIQAPFAAQQMPGMVSVPVVTQPMPATTSAAQQPARSTRAPSNQDAKRAIINGVISLVVSSFTLLTIAGFAGFVIGMFAIIYGLMGLRLASRLPNKAGRGQALIGIALGLIAWCIVIAASIFRAPLSS